MATATLINPTVSQELRFAATTAAIGSKQGSRQLPLSKSDVPSVIPSGCFINVESVKFSDLKMGDFICICVGNSFEVRRFVKVKMTKTDTYLLTAKEGFDKKEAVTRSSLMGKVVKVCQGSQTFDPSKSQNVLKQFWGKLTEYGTHKPFGLSF